MELLKHNQPHLVDFLVVKHKLLVAVDFLEVLSKNLQEDCLEVDKPKHKIQEDCLEILRHSLILEVAYLEILLLNLLLVEVYLVEVNLKHKLHQQVVSLVTKLKILKQEEVFLEHQVQLQVEVFLAERKIKVVGSLEEPNLKQQVYLDNQLNHQEEDYLDNPHNHQEVCLDSLVKHQVDYLVNLNNKQDVLVYHNNNLSNNQLSKTCFTISKAFGQQKWQQNLVSHMQENKLLATICNLL